MNSMTIVLLCVASFLIGVLVTLQFARWVLCKEALNVELQRLFLADATAPTNETEGRPRQQATRGFPGGWV